MKRFYILLIIIGVLVMLKLINSIIKDSIGNIMFRGNVVTGIVATDNGDGSYDVFISESDRAYPKIFTLSRNPDLAVGDKVRILYKNGCKELPIILPPVLSELTLFESQLTASTLYPNIASPIYYLGQHFTVESNHSVNKIIVGLSKYGEDQTGTAILDLYNADGNGFPTGSVLATANIDTSLLVWWFHPTETWGWIELILDTSVDLISGNEMVIIIRFPTAVEDSKEIYWAQQTDENNLILTGKGIYSEDSGSTWAKRRAIRTGGVDYWADFTFKIYGY